MSEPVAKAMALAEAKEAARALRVPFTAAEGRGGAGGYPMRALWIKNESYSRLRNAAWLVRHSRAGGGNNPLAVAQVVVEAGALIAGGESLPDVVEALCELLIHP